MRSSDITDEAETAVDGVECVTDRLYVITSSIVGSWTVSRGLPLVWLSVSHQSRCSSTRPRPPSPPPESCPLSVFHRTCIPGKIDDGTAVSAARDASKLLRQSVAGSMEKSW